MPEYLTPGVYVEEIDSGSKPLEGVGVNTAAFVGYAKSGEFNRPTFVSSWSEFVRIFGEEDSIVLPALSDELGRSTVELLTAKRATRPSVNWVQFAEREFSRRKRDGKMAAGDVETWEAFVKKHGLMDKLTYSVFMEDSFLAYCMKGFFDNGGDRAYVVRVARDSDLKPFLNGKGSQKAISSPARALVGEIEVTSKEKGEKGNGTKVEVQHKGDDGFTMKVTTPDGRSESLGTDKAPLTPESFSANPPSSKHVEFSAVALKERPAAVEYILKDGLTATDTQILPLEVELRKVQPEDMEGKVEPSDRGPRESRSGFRGLTQIDEINMICVPDLMAGLVSYEKISDTAYVEKVELPDEDRARIYAMQKQLISYCEQKGDRMAILDSLPGLEPMEFREQVIYTENLAADHGQAAIYYPWIRVIDETRKGKNNEKYFKLIPPSGHVAGVWARVAKERGVHKAPANEMVLSSVNLEREVTHSEQGLLNQDGLNVIRSFPGRGIRIWGARTLATVGNPSWKYVNVRRLFNYLEKTMERGLQWVVFEPNDDDLWYRVRRNLSSFLWTEWKEGKLFGLTPDEAFYVKCDRETNPEEMRDLGRLYVEVGINPVKPAEFVIVRIGQWSGGGEKAYAG